MSRYLITAAQSETALEREPHQKALTAAIAVTLALPAQAFAITGRTVVGVLLKQNEETAHF